MKAFPSKNAPYYINEDGASAHQSGMDLRDYFAAKAMQGIVDSSIDAGLETHRIAESAYNIADAMMKARTE